MSRPPPRQVLSEPAAACLAAGAVSHARQHHPLSAAVAARTVQLRPSSAFSSGCSRLSSGPVLQADQKARLRFCWFDTSNSYGIFATMPLLAQSSAPEPSLGVRYSTPQTSAGAIVQPISARLDAAWWVSPLQCRPRQTAPQCGSTYSANHGAGCMRSPVTCSVMLRCSRPGTSTLPGHPAAAGLSGGRVQPAASG